MLEISLEKRQGEFRVDAAFCSADATVTALFGRSGAGKTSVISMVAGLNRPDRGRVVLGHRILFDSTEGIDVPVHRRGIGYIFQESRLFPHYTVRGNLVYGMERVPAAERYIGFDEVVELLGIGGLLDRRPARLSGGERQRVAIGRALLSNPRLLLMDEPLASLDGARKAELLAFIAKLPGHFHLPILYVSHSVDEVLRLADRLVLMEHGRTVAEGAVEDVMSLDAFAAAAGGVEVATVIAAKVDCHDGVRGTSHLTFGGGVLRVPLMAAPPGSEVRVRIEAGSVILACTEPRGLSVQNIFSGRVSALRPKDGMVDVVVDIGCPLRAHITAQACRDLGLAVGMPVFALVKAASISRGDVAEHRGG
jgi:molybdate transport system ATP-binding protein